MIPSSVAANTIELPSGEIATAGPESRRSADFPGGATSYLMSGCICCRPICARPEDGRTQQQQQTGGGDPPGRGTS